MVFWPLEKDPHSVVRFLKNSVFRYKVVKSGLIFSKGQSDKTCIMEGGLNKYSTLETDSYVCLNVLSVLNVNFWQALDLPASRRRCS